MGPEQEKAFQINLDADQYGTFAEIGAGQEVARRFFHVGGASGTIAKTMSAYDMRFSDAIYGPCDRYVSRNPVCHTMLDRRYCFYCCSGGWTTRWATSERFSFSPTGRAARGFSSSTTEAHGWLGVRFQTQTRSEPSQIIITCVCSMKKTSINGKRSVAIGVNFALRRVLLSSAGETNFIAPRKSRARTARGGHD